MAPSLDMYRCGPFAAMPARISLAQHVLSIQGLTVSGRPPRPLAATASEASAPIPVCQSANLAAMTKPIRASFVANWQTTGGGARPTEEWDSAFNQSRSACTAGT
jgi:hypothetical protein